MKQTSKIPQNKKTKKLKPVVRTIFLVDLVFLAAVQMLTDNAIILPEVGTLATLLGAGILLAAAVLQFRSSDDER